MRKEDFRIQLIAASFLATRFGQEYVRNNLVYNFRYVVSLNESCDDNHKTDEIIYPEDKRKVLCDLSADEVVDLLVRDSRCPQWIDISVAGTSKEITLLRLLCCGRYHSDEDRLYYYQTGTQPFGIKSPTLPPGWKEGQKFKLVKPELAMDKALERRKFTN